MPRDLYFQALNLYGQQVADFFSDEEMFFLLALAAEHEETQLFDACFACFAKKARAMLHSDGFLQLDAATVLKIVEADGIEADEVLVLRALVRWRQHRLAMRAEGVPADHADRGSDSGDFERMFRSIRYSQMTGAHLVDDVAPLVRSGIIPPDLYVRALEQAATPAPLLRPAEDVAAISNCHPSVLGAKSVLCMLSPQTRGATAYVEPSTARTRITFDTRCQPNSGMALAVFNSAKGTPILMPTNKWNVTGVIVGIDYFDDSWRTYGYAVPQRVPIVWHEGFALDVVISPRSGRAQEVSLRKHRTGSDDVLAHGRLAVPSAAKLTLAIKLFFVGDSVSIESLP